MASIGLPLSQAPRQGLHTPPQPNPPTWSIGSFSEGAPGRLWRPPPGWMPLVDGGTLVVAPVAHDNVRGAT